MSGRSFRWWWVIGVLPVIAGLARLHFDADVLDLLPTQIPTVHGLKLYQEHFANSQQLIVTVQAADADSAKTAAQAVALKLRSESNFVADAEWQPPWLEHPEEMAELIGYLWLNQPEFSNLVARLAETNLPTVVADTRERLTTTLSPTDLAQLSYDPFGLTQLPESVTSLGASFSQGQEAFASADGRFRIIFVTARGNLSGYRDCADWLEHVKQAAQAVLPPGGSVTLGWTGRPAFVTEISASMKHDIILSVGGTALIIATLFWLAHRRWKPMLWLLALLALILLGTLALGGLVLGEINVVSMGFAAILLGLAVDYAVVHYQEALAYPRLSVPQIRRAIAPSIFWAAVTTISAFLVLNFGGLPGLGQLGSLVGIGVGLSAIVMILVFLPPLFPDRMETRLAGATVPPPPEPSLPVPPRQSRLVFSATVALILFCVLVLAFGFPGMDSGTHAMEPRHSPAYAALHAMEENLGNQQEPVCLIVSGRDESDIAATLAAIKPVLDGALSNHVLASFTLPDALWPRPDVQMANRRLAQKLVREAGAMRAAATNGGFSADALGLSDRVLETWQRAGEGPGIFWPGNTASQWIFQKIAAHDSTNLFAAGYLFPASDPGSLTSLPLPPDGVWLSSWSLLGRAVFEQVKHNLWKMLAPMLALVFLSLWLAFGRLTEICLSVAVLLLSGSCLLAVMRLAGWSWNVLNLMSLPLILGTGVDYSLFMQLALRRHGGSLAAARDSVGRALLLCGGTAIAGFGSLGMSSNAGMSSLGRVCAVGLAGNMMFSIFLLPVWWKFSTKKSGPDGVMARAPGPSQFYRGAIWKAGLVVARVLPVAVIEALAKMAAAVYWQFSPYRRGIVIENLRPGFDNDLGAARRAARQLFTEFALKITDLWRYESGAPLEEWNVQWIGWDIYQAAQARGRGVLLVTPHLGNWEIGGAFVPHKGLKLVVLTQAEPDPLLTELRKASRAARGVETIVVGEDAFAFLPIVQRLQQGDTVALLLDRPVAPTAVPVTLFGRPFAASMAAAELARASGCAILPSRIVRTKGGYYGEISPEISYDRTEIGNRAARAKLTQKIMTAFEPSIREYISQWFHFVPIWPRQDK